MNAAAPGIHNGHEARHLAKPMERAWPHAPLTRATLLRRYKRFLADVRFEDETEATVHCPNPGSMIGMRTPGADVLLSHDPSPRRKLPWTLELIRPPGITTWIGCNTMRANAIVADLLQAGRLPVDASQGIRREVPVGASRIDLAATGRDGRPTFIEVKSTTLAGPHAAATVEEMDACTGSGLVALFPDAVTARGARHMRELAALARQGHRAVVVFLVNRGDCRSFAVARRIDPAYAAALAEAVEAGVEVLPVALDVDADGWRFRGTLPTEPALAGITP